MKVIIIGGGAAGMVAAISASQDEKNDVILLEKNDRLGKKLSITGKGRCNITSSLSDMNDFIKNTPVNGKFLYSAFKNFTNKDIIKLLGIPTKVERGNRVFPVSDRAQDVVDALERKLNKKNIQVLKGVTAKKLLIDENKKEVIGVETQDKKMYADKVILATGGASYKTTGSTGDGYRMAKEIGHTIIEIRPSLVAMTANDNSIEICQKLQGLTLKNVSIKGYENNKIIYEDFGEMLFTHFGVSGPIILSASAHFACTKMKNPNVIIDMKPALNEEKLNERILRDFDKYKNKEIKNALDDLLPQKMIPVIIELSKIDFNKKVNEITKEERKKLIFNIKNLKIELSGFRPINEAIITKGGISTKEINPKTMESKLYKNLYFAGEIIDVDAYTGGFNLQIAYSTGYTAGMLQE